MKNIIYSLFFCLVSFYTFHVTGAEIDLSENQVSQLEELNLASEKIESTESEEELGQALAAEAASRSTDSPEVLDMVASIFGYYPHQVVTPISEGWSYVDGARCHVGNYANFYVLTVFEGINRGSQLIVSYSGQMLSVNSIPEITYTHQGVLYTHTYSNSELVTGINQVMYVL